MAKYNGSVELISGITQANGQDFPLMESHAIQVDDTGTRLDEALQSIKKENAVPMDQGLGLVWLGWSNNIERGNGIENDAIMFSKHALVGMQRLNLYRLADSKPVFTENTLKILKRAKELNPELRTFEYIQSESGRTDFTYNGDHAHLNPDGSWEGSTADLSGSTRIYTYQQICDWLDYFKETGTDGVFFDDWGYDFAKEDICYQMGLSVDDYEDKNAALNKKWIMLIEACHERNLFLVTNGNMPFNVGDWYTYLNEDDVICLESCLISSSNYKDDYTWQNGQKNIYDYYANWYSNGKCKAKIWTLNYFPGNAGDYEDIVLTYLCAMTLACGGGYVSMGTFKCIEKPAFVDIFSKGNTKSITKIDENIYQLKVNSHVLEVHQWKNLSGNVSKETADKNYCVLDGKKFNNGFLTAPVVERELMGEIEGLSEKVNNATDDSKKNAISYWRMAIDDWNASLTFSDYTNFISGESESHGISGGTIETIQNSDGTIDIVCTYTDLSQGGIYLSVIRPSNYEEFEQTGEGLEFGFSDVIFDMSDDSWSLPNGTVYEAKWLWSVPSFYIYADMQPLDGPSTTDYKIDGIGSDVGMSTGHYKKTTKDVFTSYNIRVWFHAPENEKFNGKVTIKNAYVIDLGEHSDEISKKWYTNIFPVNFNSSSAMNAQMTPDTKNGWKVYDYIVSHTNAWGWAKYKYTGEEVIALRGHTIELGCTSLTFSDESTGIGSASNGWVNYAFGVGVNTDNPNTVRLYANTKNKSQVWDGEKLCCLTYTIPDDATSLCIGFQSYGFSTNVEVSLDNVYMYDLGEEVSIRGKSPTNASLRLCRINEEQEELTPSNMRNALYVTEKGNVYMYDLKGTKVDIAGSVYTGAVTAGYMDSPRKFGRDLYKMINTDIGSIEEDSRLLPVPTSEDEGKTLKVTNGKWQMREEKMIIIDPVPENLVLYEEVDDEEPPINMENLIKEHLRLEADGEYMYLMYDSEVLSKVPMAGNSDVIYCGGIKIKESDMTLYIGSENSYILSAIVEPSDCTQTVKWSSSDTSVIRISSKGEMTLIGEGIAVITVECGNYTDSITVTVLGKTVKIGIGNSASWYSNNGTIPSLGGNTNRAFTYSGETCPVFEDLSHQVLEDSSYAYGVPLKKGIKYNTELNAASGCYYGLQIYSSVSKTRVVDSGWQNPGTKYVYTPTEDGLYLYVNFKYGAAGSTTITDEILANIKAGFTITMGDS